MNLEPPDFHTCDFGDDHKDSPPGPGFRVLPPVFRHFGARKRFFGPVRTVKCFEDNSPVKAALDTPGDGAILVVDGGGSVRRALVGGNLAAAAVNNGWAGLVVDGAVRDFAELQACELGIRALALMPLPTRRSTPGQSDLPIVIQGVAIHPGDWLYADEDGIVISNRPLHRP